MAMLVNGFLVLWLGAGGSIASEAPDPDKVVNGQEAAVCDFPADVFVSYGGGSGCTGSLVHPRVVVTAAHCAGGITHFGFGESASSPVHTTSVEQCHTHPESGFGGPDLAFCTLTEDAPTVDIAPVIMGCEVDQLMPGTDVIIAGFGITDEQSGVGGGTKRWTTNAIDYSGTNYIYLLGQSTGSCYGDSGGPAYVQLDDGSWRVFAAVQGPHPQAPALGCGFGGTYTLIHPHMEWIESTSGYDITPCFDANGTWNPDDRCQQFPTELTAFGGAWASWCEGAQLSGPGETCGDANPDIDPPPGGTTGGDESGGAEDSIGDSADGDSADGDSADGTGDGGDAGDDDEGGTDGDGSASAGAGGGWLPPAYGAGSHGGCRVAVPRSSVFWVLIILFARRRCR